MARWVPRRDAYLVYLRPRTGDPAPLGFFTGDCVFDPSDRIGGKPDFVVHATVHRG